MTSHALLELEIRVDPNDVDEDQFVSIWNVAAATMDRDPVKTRMLASKFLGFLCKYRCGFLIASPSDAKYLDDWFERDPSLLNDWKPESDKVDVVADIPSCLLTLWSASWQQRSSPPRRITVRCADRLEWFTQDWNVGERLWASGFGLVAYCIAAPNNSSLSNSAAIEWSF